ncbi:low temperature requirement protein A [Micromonospora costi]|uniref:Low temperature requirement protein A n=1 Tax=Micromonospora costi TaxID=1530042 RepID=A0A3B0A1K6_9ACTN|nr:low temperature requirement protein A [Micromonospora costi]RKN54548.1 low temperature requirement protein A [Micromonospora costi]
MRLFRSRYEQTAETHRTTTFEIFFDLVFVFALTRIVEFMAHPATAVTMGRGLLLFLLLWYSWSAYAWLGNEVRADVGLIRTGTLAAMAAMFVAALVIPNAWRSDSEGAVPAPLILALSYVAVRVLHVLLYLHVSASRQLSRTLRLVALPGAVGWLTLVAGALVGGGTAQTALWALAFAIDVGGGRFATRYSPWQLRSASHFSERHRLVLIIAIGEALISIGTGAGAEMTGWLLLAAALLGFAVAVSLWRLYFDRVAPAVEGALAEASDPRRGVIAADAYSLAHFPLIAGIMYVALGIEQVLATLIHATPTNVHGAVGMPGVVALYAGGALYLAGRTLVVRLATGRVPLLPLAGAAVLLVLLPVAALLPALAALALLVVVLAAQCTGERRWPGRLGQQPPRAGRPPPAPSGPVP